MAQIDDLRAQVAAAVAKINGAVGDQNTIQGLQAALAAEKDAHQKTQGLLDVANQQMESFANALKAAAGN